MECSTGETMHWQTEMWADKQEYKTFIGKLLCKIIIMLHFTA